jgi:hypothetical protein
VGVYVDAFNVYYGGLDHCGRGIAGWRWLDLASLTRSLINTRLWPGAVVDRLIYCTAPRDRAGDPTSITDQQTYIEALRNGSVPAIVVNGQYVPRVKSGDLVDQRGRRVASPGPTALPGWLPAREATGPDGTPVLRARITTFEEKGSDVNVASHLLIDVLDRRIDAAIVYSNDSDLYYPLHEARLRVPVGTVNPGKKPTAAALRGDPAVGAGRHWWRRLSGADFTAHQFPPTVGPAQRPAGW